MSNASSSDSNKEYEKRLENIEKHIKMLHREITLIKQKILPRINNATNYNKA